ncbi:FtsX-like permease family protein [Gulosibacter sp. 10]|uniref:FtsX-like permease family protein n=1 Tax=Gulosibacter sp. 10 TaxID=1255570 RepID=UPI00097EBBD6|nr:FtsX-like permease family protein [Gulosibacter sp. 10]SJM63733.1 putative ABC transporter integral membrane protein [Gulosibacter sp. 10]
MSGPLGALGPWRAVLRLARRDARRHLLRTVLASLLIALPIAALVLFATLTSDTAPSREQALAGIPAGAQAVLTSTALPREAPPFPQLPEGPGGPWMDDPEIVPADAGELAALLDPEAELLEYWLSPELILSPELGLAPGEQRDAGEGAAMLDSVDFAAMSTVTLHEAEPGALPMLAPDPVEGRLPADPTELLIGEALADRLGVGPGDALGLLAPPDHGWRSTEGNTMAAMQDSERGYTVVGIAAHAGDRVWASAGWLASLAAAHPEGIQRHWLVTGDAPVTWEQAQRLNGLQAFAVSRHVLEHYPDASLLYPVELDPGVALERTIGILAATLGGALLVLFLVTPAFAVSAEQARRALGLASAVGASPRDLRRTILAQGIVLGAGSGILGAAAGFAGSLGLAAWLDSLAADGVDPEHGLAATLAHYPWWALPLGVLIALVLGALAALPPARTAARLVPVDALRDRAPAPARRRGGILARFLGPVLLLASAGLAWGLLALPPEGSAALLGPAIALVLVMAALGAVLAVRAAIAWLGSRGARARPALRLALRDAADHPSRTVPAALGVLFAIAAASFSILYTGSLVANGRDEGSTLDWDGTFMVSPQAGVSDEFDRLLATSAVEELRGRLPQITGSEPVFEIPADSPLSLQPLPPEGRECPPGQGIHAASANDPEAPLRCADQDSRAVFSPGFRFGGLSSSGNTMLFTGDALRATRLPGAEEAAATLEAGGAVVNNAALIDADGYVRVTVDPDLFADPDDAERVVRLPAVFLQGAGAPFLIAPDTAQALGVETAHYLGELVTVSSPLSEDELRGLDAGETFSSLVLLQIPDAQGPLTTALDRTAAAMVWAPIALFAGVAIVSATVAVLLSATQGRRDAITMHSVGADRGFLTRLSLARAAVILAVGVPAGLAAGLGLGAYLVAWNRRLEASGPWLDTVPVWEAQAGLALAVVLAASAAALLFARPPRRFDHRRLD